MGVTLLNPTQHKVLNSMVMDMKPFWQTARRDRLIMAQHKEGNGTITMVMIGTWDGRCGRQTYNNAI